MQSDVDDEEPVAVVVKSPLHHVVVGAEHLIVLERVGLRCPFSLSYNLHFSSVNNSNRFSVFITSIERFFLLFIILALSHP